MSTEHTATHKREIKLSSRTQLLSQKNLQNMEKGEIGSDRKKKQMGSL